MLVDNHKARLHRCHDITALILIMRRWLVFYQRLCCRLCGCWRDNRSFLNSIAYSTQATGYHLLLMLFKEFWLTDFTTSTQVSIEFFPSIWNRRLSRLRCLFERVIGRIEVYLWCRHTDIGVEHRDIRFPLRIKVNGRDIIKASYCLLYSSKQNLPNSLFVLKLYLGFGRVNIYIDILCWYIEVKEVGYLFSLRYQSIKSRDNSLMEIRMFHIAVVDKEILMGCFLTCWLWLTNKTMNMTKTRINVYW